VQNGGTPSEGALLCAPFGLLFRRRKSSPGYGGGAHAKPRPGAEPRKKEVWDPQAPHRISLVQGGRRGVQLGDEGAELLRLVPLVLDNVGGGLGGEGLVAQLGLDALQVALGLGLL